MSQRPPQTDVDRLIASTHRRFVKAMDGRMGSLTPEMKESYFTVLSKLVAKLETDEKTLREVAQEMIAESMTEVLQMVQG